MYTLGPLNETHGHIQPLLEKINAEARQLAGIYFLYEESLAFHLKRGFSQCGRLEAAGRNFDLVLCKKEIKN